MQPLSGPYTTSSPARRKPDRAPRLGRLAQRTDTRLEIAPDDNGRWGLEIVDGDGRLPAYKAEAELQAAAVRRVPEFLAAYSKRLKEAAGSKVTVSLADQLVEAVATLETEASA